MIANINAVSSKARDAGVPVVLIQHETDEGPFRHEADGWHLAAGLETHPGDLRLRKRASDAFHQTGLQALLHERGVDQLVICGLQSDFCVDTTVRRALALGYPVVLVADGHSTLDNGVLTAAQISAHHTLTLTKISSFGVRATAVLSGDVDFRDWPT